MQRLISGLSHVVATLAIAAGLGAAAIASAVARG